MAKDRIQQEVSVGDVVNVPMVVTAIGGTDARPTFTGTTKYAGFDDATDSVGPFDSIQCAKDQLLPNQGNA